MTLKIDRFQMWCEHCERCELCERCEEAFNERIIGDTTELNTLMTMDIYLVFVFKSSGETMARTF